MGIVFLVLVMEFEDIFTEAVMMGSRLWCGSRF